MLGDSEALAHLTWLLERGYAVAFGPVYAADHSGNTAALQYLLLVLPVGIDENEAAVFAAEGGHLAALQALHAAGWPIHPPSCATAAAKGGHLNVMALLLEAQWPELAVLDAELFSAAAGTGSVVLWRHGCPWNAGAYAAAAALEWLAVQG
ncbi:hypothetical protein GPECTOR_30g174 [Gonium pectorale]|uniref:Ankyrin repeat domain-containing protein n=1 Tax=Gonium pectorale TaxID=33097 RepID=A0A150GE13_GONPE|nr:hypothetical protein GPECTOR_30g174 [Gonium pectorale]|eukprot:KXZ48079.1 hypothetical protein GPECTOR_30g174 [Gonium pectorale]